MPAAAKVDERFTAVDSKPTNIFIVKLDFLKIKRHKALSHAPFILF